MISILCRPADLYLSPPRNKWCRSTCHQTNQNYIHNIMFPLFLLFFLLFVYYYFSLLPCRVLVFRFTNGRAVLCLCKLWLLYTCRHWYTLMCSSYIVHVLYILEHKCIYVVYLCIEYSVICYAWFMVNEWLLVIYDSLKAGSQTL